MFMFRTYSKNSKIYFRLFYSFSTTTTTKGKFPLYSRINFFFSIGSHFFCASVCVHQFVRCSYFNYNAKTVGRLMSTQFWSCFFLLYFGFVSLSLYFSFKVRFRWLYLYVNMSVHFDCVMFGIRCVSIWALFYLSVRLLNLEYLVAHLLAYQTSTLDFFPQNIFSINFAIILSISFTCLLYVLHYINSTTHAECERMKK